MTPASSLFVETARDDSRLVALLVQRLRGDAIAASRRISMQLLEATPSGSEPMWRRARVLFLLSIDALNADRAEAARSMRWRRFIAALAPFASETKSPQLSHLVSENADLLSEATPPQFPAKSSRR